MYFCLEICIFLSIPFHSPVLPQDMSRSLKHAQYNFSLPCEKKMLANGKWGMTLLTVGLIYHGSNISKLVNKWSQMNKQDWGCITLTPHYITKDYVTLTVHRDTGTWKFPVSLWRHQLCWDLVVFKSRMCPNMTEVLFSLPQPSIC